MHDNEYDPYGGHTKEEADAAFEELFNELHGDKNAGASGAKASDIGISEAGASGAGISGTGTSGVNYSNENLAKDDLPKVYVMAPQNSGIDAICATICYAYLKNLLIPTVKYIPCAPNTIPSNTTSALNIIKERFKEKETTVEKAVVVEKTANANIADDDNYSPENEITEQAANVDIVNDENYSPENEIILVGHNNPNIGIQKFNIDKIIEIIDCHALQGLITNHALTVRIQPHAAVSTIIALLFREVDIIPAPYYSGLLCMGIVNSTQSFQKENTTQADKLEAVSMASNAGLDIQALAAEIEKINEKR